MINITKYLKKNFAVSVVKMIVVSSVTLLLLPLIIKRLGLELYGVISLTLLFSGVCSLVDLGLSKAVVLLSGEKKISENRIVSSALYINIFIIGILSFVFVLLQVFSVDLLGSDLNIDKTNKFILLNAGFLLLVLMLLNNLCRAVLEANYKIHIVNLTLTLYTPILYLTIYILSFFTKKMTVYVLTPLVLTLLLFLFYIVYIRMMTSVKIVRVVKGNVIYVLKKSFAFLNIGLIISMIMPLMRYVFILMVANLELYAVFDLTFKIALLANSFILSIASPMFAVFSKEIKTNSKKMVRVAYNIFYASIGVYVAIIIGYYFLGNYFLVFLNLDEKYIGLLYNVTYVLIMSLGSVAIVEIFYRYFLGNDQLTVAFLLKLIVPVFGIVSFFLLRDFDLIYRLIYSYGIGLSISAIATVISFVINNKTKTSVVI